MAEPERSSGDPSTAGVGQVVALALVGGVVAGLLLWLLTVLVEQSNIRGDGWSLAGNGALIVPFLGLPMVLIVGTIALGRRFGGTGRGWSIAAGGIVFGLSLIAGFIAGTRLSGQP